MAGWCFISPPASASSCLLLLFFSSTVIMSEPLPHHLDSTWEDSRALEHAKNIQTPVFAGNKTGDLIATLHELFRVIEDGSRSLVHGEESAQAMTSSLRVQRNLSEEDEALQATEREVEPGQAWPHHLLDFMGHQNRFKGRTKKNVRKRLMEAELGELTEVLMG